MIRKISLRLGVRCQSRITIEKKGLMPGMLLLEGRKSDEFSVKKVYGT